MWLWTGLVMLNLSPLVVCALLVRWWRQRLPGATPAVAEFLRPCYRRVGIDRHRCASFYFYRLVRVGDVAETPVVVRCALCGTAYRLNPTYRREDGGQPMIPEDIGWAEQPWPEIEP